MPGAGLRVMTVGVALLAGVATLAGIARLPTGLERTLIQIDDWDVNWQDAYRYVEPVSLPRGTTIRVEFVSDPLARTRRNPVAPAQPPASGQNLYDEYLWLQVLPKTAADRARLDGGIRR